MSLTMALRNSLAGLAVNQKSLSVTTQNISNANTEGYTKKSVIQESTSVDGQPTGVLISGIERQVDEYLQRSTRIYSSQLAASEKIYEYFDKIQVFFGAPNTENNLQSYVDNFFNALKDMADNPESASIRQNALNAGLNVSREISSTAQNLQDTRFLADQEMTHSVADINNILNKLQSINSGIARSQSTSGSADPELLDQRDNYLNKLSQYMNISTYTNESGTVSVYTGNGVPLVDYQAFQLSYLNAASKETFNGNVALNPLNVYPTDIDGALTGEPFALVSRGVGTEISSVLSGGSLEALHQMRDIEIPKILSSLDEFAATFRDAFNEIHNDGTGFPPPSELTGTREVDYDDVHDWTGSVMFGSVLNSGRAIPSAYSNDPYGIRPLTLNLGTLDVGNGDGRMDVKTLVDEFNAHFGPQQKKIQIGNMNDIRLVAQGDNTPAATTMTFDLDLENISARSSSVKILAVTPSAGSATFTTSAKGVAAGEKIRTGVDQSITAAFGAAGTHTLTVQFEVTDADGTVSVADIAYTVITTNTDIRNDRYVGTLGTVSSGTASSLQPTYSSRIARASLVNKEGEVVSAGGAGYFHIEVEDPARYGISINDINSSENGIPAEDVDGTGRGFSHYFELNDFFVRNDFDEEGLKNSALNLAIRSDILDNANLISSGKLILGKQPASSTAAPNYTYELGAGDNQVAERQAQLFKSILTFDDSGALNATSKTISGYLGDVVGAAAASTGQAETNSKKDRFLYDSFKNKSDAASSVSMDEELGNTVIYQNAYAASARIITVVNAMFESLMQAR